MFTVSYGAHSRGRSRTRSNAAMGLTVEIFNFPEVCYQAGHEWMTLGRPERLCVGLLL